MTPSDRVGVVSRSGIDVEAQIADGGGIANMRGRGGPEHEIESLDLGPDRLQAASTSQ